MKHLFIGLLVALSLVGCSEEVTKKKRVEEPVAWTPPTEDRTETPTVSRLVDIVTIALDRSGNYDGVDIGLSFVTQDFMTYFVELADYSDDELVRIEEIHDVREIKAIKISRLPHHEKQNAINYLKNNQNILREMELGSLVNNKLKGLQYTVTGIEVSLIVNDELFLENNGPERVFQVASGAYIELCKHRVSNYFSGCDTSIEAVTELNRYRLNSVYNTLVDTATELLNGLEL